MSNNNLPHWDLTPIYMGVDTPDFLEDIEKVVTLSNKLKSDVEEHKPLFDVITSLNEIITRIEKLKELKEVSDVFYEQSKDRVKKNSTKQFLSNPFKAL